MENKIKRIILFLCGCILVRAFMAIGVKYIPPKYLPIVGGIALIPAVVWIILFFSKKRLTGPEVFGGEIWWNDLRIVHALLYILFAIYAIQKKKFAWIVLIVDVLVGLVGFSIFHIKNRHIPM